MSKQHYHVRALMHRAFAVFLTVFLISDVGRVYASRNLQIIAQQGEAQTDAMRAEAEKLTQEGLQLYKQGNKESLLRARKKYEAAMLLWEKLGDKKWQAVTVLGIGKIYLDLGGNQKALQYYNQALLLFRAAGNKYGEATTLINIGGVYSYLGENQKTLQYLNQALPILRTVGDKSMEATTLNNIGMAYSDLGDKQKALQFLNQALPLRRAVGNRSKEATTLHNIGGVYSDLEENQKAVQYYNQALLLSRAVGDRGGEAYTLNNIAGVYSDLGQNQKALQIHNQALPLFRAVGDRRMEAYTLNNIGGVYDTLGDHLKALQYFNQALPLRRAVGDRGGEATTLGNLADLERKQGNLQASLNHIKSAIAIIEDLRGTYTNQDLKTTYFSTVQGYYKFYIDLLMEQHKKNPSQGYDALALHISERSRARGLIELLAQANAKLSKNVDPKFIAEEKELQLKRQAQEKIIAQLVSQTPTPKDTIKQTEAEIQNIINQQKQLKAKIRAQNPERDKITNPEPLKLPEIQQQLEKDTVLLQYSLGKKRSYLWLVTPTALTSYELPPGEEIEKIAKEFHSGLASRNLSIDSAQKLSEIILAPVKDKLAGKRLVIVADGVLQQIPFAALHNLTPQPPSLQGNGEQE
ncbi:MAG: tetratricopeptide repeat protein, partial [Rivularia sp. (in: cyanobacteria)]